MKTPIITALTLALTCSAASALAAPADPKAPRVDAVETEKARAYVQTVGILGLLQADGSAAAAVLSSSAIGSELERAVAALRGRQLAARAPVAPFRAATPSSPSVSIGVVQVSDTPNIELAQHRAHNPATPPAR
jgi:hypothetical protein